MHARALLRASLTSSSSEISSATGLNNSTMSELISVKLTSRSLLEALIMSAGCGGLNLISLMRAVRSIRSTSDCCFFVKNVIHTWLYNWIRYPSSSCSGSSTRSMDVCIYFFRGLELDDEINLREIETSTGNVCCNKTFEFTLFEGVESDFSLLLSNVSVKDLHLHG